MRRPSTLEPTALLDPFCLDLPLQRKGEERDWRRVRGGELKEDKELEKDLSGKFQVGIVGEDPISGPSPPPPPTCDPGGQQSMLLR